MAEEMISVVRLREIEDRIVTHRGGVITVGRKK